MCMRMTLQGRFEVCRHLRHLRCHRSWRREDEERVALHRSSSRGLSRQAYLLQWAYKAAAHPQAALEHMLLLGYRGEPSALFSVSAPRRQERKPEAAKRGTFQVGCTSSEAQSMHLCISGHLRISERAPFNSTSCCPILCSALMTVAPWNGILRSYQ